MTGPGPKPAHDIVHNPARAPASAPTPPAAHDQRARDEPQNPRHAAADASTEAATRPQGPNAAGTAKPNDQKTTAVAPISEANETAARRPATTSTSTAGHDAPASTTDTRAAAAAKTKPTTNAVHDANPDGDGRSENATAPDHTTAPAIGFQGSRSMKNHATEATAHACAARRADGTRHPSHTRKNATPDARATHGRHASTRRAATPAAAHAATSATTSDRGASPSGTDAGSAPSFTAASSTPGHLPGALKNEGRAGAADRPDGDSYKARPTTPGTRMQTHARSLLAESWHRNGYARTPNEARRRNDGSKAYKKGWEVRLMANDAKEARRLRRALSDIGFASGRTFAKGQFLVLPVYGKAAYDYFQNL